jgi:nicotinamide mononucleotide (NMN) deamidase PncC
MAVGVAKLLHADIGLSLTGVAGPTQADGQPVGTVFVGLSGNALSTHGGAGQPEIAQLSLGGNRYLVRERATTSSLDLLRRRLLERGAGQPNQ